MTTLRAAVRPLISSTSTVEEVLREASATFAQPTPLIRAMMNLLAELSDEISSLQEEAPACGPAVNCPACGAVLHLED